MSNIKLFESTRIRSVWNDAEQRWYFSVVDMVQVLTDSANPTDYLKKLRKREPELGSYLGTNCPQVAMPNADGIGRKTLAGNVEQLLRIIQSIPSPKAEPFKRWPSYSARPRERSASTSSKMDKLTRNNEVNHAEN